MAAAGRGRRARSERNGNRSAGAVRQFQKYPPQPQKDRWLSVLPSHGAAGAFCRPFRPALPWVRLLEAGEACQRRKVRRNFGDAAHKLDR
jgi:hypothetical protein